MPRPAERTDEIEIKPHKKFIFVPPKKKGPSTLSILVEDLLLKTKIWTALQYANIVAIYFYLLILVAGIPFTMWHAAFYPTLIYIVYLLRKTWIEKERKENAHRIPFFADALANSLSVGSSLGQAFQQSIYYLRGRLKSEFEKVMLKYSYGKELGPLLHGLENKFPNTGLKYLISLLDEYKDLGIGISPLLKRISDALKEKLEAEEKIHTILSAGSGYAKVSIVVFGFTFSLLSFMLKDQIPLLLTPKLKPVLTILVAWALVGIFFVTRITAIDFVNHSALRPYIANFMNGKEWTIPNLISYSGLHLSFSKWLRAALYFPLIVGFLAAYVFSWHTENIVLLEISLLLGVLLARLAVEFYLKGLVEGQLIKSVELFPEFLQVFVIGLNSGLNSFMALQFAIKAIEGTAPEVLRRELLRVKSALECGEDHTKVWQRFSDYLPFEIVVDFCEIMIISPLHGSSIEKSLHQMMKSFQQKKMNLIEKKAMKVGQVVIPVIVIAFFPLFLFVVFGPLWTKISVLFQNR